MRWSPLQSPGRRRRYRERPTRNSKRRSTRKPTRLKIVFFFSIPFTCISGYKTPCSTFCKLYYNYCLGYYCASGKQYSAVSSAALLPLACTMYSNARVHSFRTPLSPNQAHKLVGPCDRFRQAALLAEGAKNPSPSFPAPFLPRASHLRRLPFPLLSLLTGGRSFSLNILRREGPEGPRHQTEPVSLPYGSPDRQRVTLCSR